MSGRFVASFTLVLSINVWKLSYLSCAMLRLLLHCLRKEESLTFKLHQPTETYKPQ